MPPLERWEKRTETPLSVAALAFLCAYATPIIWPALGQQGRAFASGVVGITDAERDQPGATITDFGDGLWWAMTTMTTVGYGDTYPTTAAGRLVAAALMVGGIALLGVVTATLASWLVQRVAETTEAEQVATRGQVLELTAQVEALRVLLHERVNEAGSLRDDEHDRAGREVPDLRRPGRVV